jgi:hypothetical protein
MFAFCIQYKPSGEDGYARLIASADVAARLDDK